jgi:hypothetical protein
VIAPRSMAAMAARPLLFGGGNRADVLRLVADLCERLAAWIERDHCLGDMAHDESARVTEVVRLLRSAATTAEP